MAVMLGLNEISGELKTVNNYTQLLQTELQSLNDRLTESKQQTLGLIQCDQLPVHQQTECTETRREMTIARLSVDYTQVKKSLTY